MIGNKSVSLCMVVYDDSELVEKVINSAASIVDEIVIVDQGSSEKHSQELRKLATIYSKTTNKGNADYDRQFCYALATKDMILALDADEIISLETIKEVRRIVDMYDFDIMWFLFDNTVFFEEKTVNLSKLLGGDPHPRFWKRRIQHEGKEVTPLLWPHEAHKFPEIATERQVFLEKKIEHHRDLRAVIKTHLHRGKNISRNGIMTEKEFIRQLLNEFGLDVKKKVISEFPELSEYLRN